MECSRPTVVFTFAGESCGIPAGDACELVFLPALLRVAGQPSILSGFMNLRGAAVPVVRLERLFGRPAGPEDGYTTLVLVGSGGSALALAVDRVDDVLLLGPGDLRPVGKGQSFNDCATAEFDFNGRRATLLDASRILLEKERQCIEELRARAQAEMETPGASCR